MNEILKKAMELINKAQNDQEFIFEHSDNLIATGERSVDYSAYCFDLSEDYYLILDFKDFSFEDFSIFHKFRKSLINDL